MRFTSYVVLSTTAMIAVLYYAYYIKKQLYPTMLFLVSSKVSFLIAGNLAVAYTLVVTRMIKTLYFGALRETEVEILMERAKYSLIETAIALTIFRFELDTYISALFGLLVLVKLVHKLSKTRLEYFEQITPITTAVQLRMGFLLVSLLALDGLVINYATNYVLANGKSVLILFGFEFGLLFIYAFNLGVRFLLQVIDNNLAGGLNSRALIVMIVDLFCDFVKVSVYGVFFTLIFTYYGTPFHLIRDLWAALVSFQRKFSSFLKYLRLTQNLDNRFPDATPEEIRHAVKTTNFK